MCDCAEGMKIKKNSEKENYTTMLECNEIVGKFHFGARIKREAMIFLYFCFIISTTTSEVSQITSR